MTRHLPPPAPTHFPARPDYRRDRRPVAAVRALPMLPLAEGLVVLALFLVILLA